MEFQRPCDIFQGLEKLEKIFRNLSKNSGNLATVGQHHSCTSLNLRDTLNVVTTNIEKVFAEPHNR